MKLYDYQNTYLNGLPSSCIMSADLGTGKTLMSLAHWQRQQTGRPLLVVAPASKIRTEDWQAEALRWFDLKTHNHICNTDGKYCIVPEIIFISYESLRLMDKETKRPRWWKYTGARNGGTVYDVIADECHWLKNPQSKQSKAIYEITRSGGLFIGLTGTPLSNGWIDFAGYSKIFNFTKGITEFKTKYCRIQDYKGFPEIIGYNNTEELSRQFKSIAFPLDRNKAKELPDKQTIGVNISLDKKLSKRYLELKLTRQDKRTGELLDSAPRLLSVLRQSTTDGRLDSLMSIVDDTSDNIIIFYNYISERKAILKLLAKTDKHILRYDGEQHSILPHIAGDHFSDMKNTVLVAHYKSASTGLNLQWANVTIYFSPSYSYQEFTQSKGRTHRQGQSKKCLYYLFNVRNTVDYDIWACLREKKDFSEKLWSADDEA